MKLIKCWAELESTIEVDDDATDEEIEQAVYDYLSDQFSWGFHEVDEKRK